jgi:hypothetical protein
MIKREKIVEDGVIHNKVTWKEPVYPICIIWDECQALKNEDSMQSIIGQSYNDVKNQRTIQIYSSATPFTSVSEAKCFAVATKLEIEVGTRCVPLSPTSIGLTGEPRLQLPPHPEEHSPKAVERLMTELLPYIVDVKGVRPQFKAINKVLQIDFANEKDRQLYNLAFERYLKEKAELEGSAVANSQLPRPRSLPQVSDNVPS